MRVLITGASGFIGSHLVQATLDAGHEVVACVRKPIQAQQRWPGITAIESNFATDHSSHDWIPRLDGIDVVINAVGIISESGKQGFDALHTLTPIALFRACEVVKLHRVIQISALGATASAASRYHLSKHAADHYLRNTPLDWAVVMPSIVYGPGAKSMALFKAMGALPFIPLIGAGEQQIQPIHVDDLCKAVVQLVISPSNIQADIEMVGPKPVSMRELLSRLHQWLGLGEARFVSVPFTFALAGARLAGLFRQSPVTPETIRMLCKGNTAEVHPFVSRFGFQPQSLEHSLTAIPAQQADQWHAGLYFLRPILRIAIALVWLFTGIISACIFPVEHSYAMLNRVGIDGIWLPLMLYAAALLDIALGLATMTAYKLRLVGLIQIAVILLYSLIITASLPEQWLHPFGPMSKNLPLLVSIMIMLVLERR